MSLALPADAEPFIEVFDDLHRPAVYCLRLTRPDDLAAAWDAEFDARPPYLHELRDAETVLYVGATGDLLGRLEDHRDKEVRVAGLLRVCDIDALDEVWLFDTADEAFEAESRIGMRVAHERPDAYVHFR
jgi:predicted GIY-YIG superfamily endonuclease